MEKINVLKLIKGAKDFQRDRLDLSHKQLTSLPPEIGDITTLKWLELRENQLTSLPPEIIKLKNLKILDLAGNQLTSLPPEIIKLTNLKDLFLSRNQLTSLPPEIGELTNLKDFSLSKNQLKSLPPEIGHLTKLTNLGLSDNKLTSLPTEIRHLTKLTNIYLTGNPLEFPPIEIAEKGIKEINDYFNSLQGEKQPLNEVKVLFVGDGGAGKTSLLKRLLGERFDETESQTSGINIKRWNLKEGANEIKMHLWDFGGQEIMHATHQFFLSKRSLYVLVLDGRKEEKTEYWLKNIESFGGDSPILIVLNKMDENPSFDINRAFLQEKYPSIKGFYPISCKTSKGIETFVEGLSIESIKMELRKTLFAKNWLKVKTQLENMDSNFISYDDYILLCEKENISDKSSQDTLIDFLNDLGVILHFKDLELLDTQVLNPKWVTGAVYRIINSEKLAENKGFLRFDDLDDILKMKKNDYYYPRSKYLYIIDLMKKFELCYEIDNKTVLVPNLLDIQEPRLDFNYSTCLKFLLDYDFLPKSVMLRFIVKMHKDIKNQLRWRTGVVLEDQTFHSTALIKADERDQKIFIYVEGEQKRDYFSVILFNFREINRNFEKLKYVERVPMPDDPKITVSYNHLITLERRNIKKYMPDGSEIEYDVKDLLGTIYIKNDNEEEILQILRKIKDKSDNKETLLKKANDIFLLKPSFMGVGLNINEIIKKLSKE